MMSAAFFLFLVFRSAMLGGQKKLKQTSHKTMSFTRRDLKVLTVLTVLTCLNLPKVKRRKTFRSHLPCTPCLPSLAKALYSGVSSKSGTENRLNEKASEGRPSLTLPFVYGFWIWKSKTTLNIFMLIMENLLGGFSLLGVFNL